VVPIVRKEEDRASRSTVRPNLLASHSKFHAEHESHLSGSNSVHVAVLGLDSESGTELKTNSGV
jgi:hypothetical protein